jgi:hypothetical protein
MNAHDGTRFSIVVPLYNEAVNLTPLYVRLTQVMATLEGRYEIIFVDDGSRDGTPQLLPRSSRSRQHQVSARLFHPAAPAFPGLLRAADDRRGDSYGIRRHRQEAAVPPVRHASKRAASVWRDSVHAGGNSAPVSGSGVGNPVAHLLRIAEKTDLRHTADSKPRAGVDPRYAAIVSPVTPDSPANASAGVSRRSPESQ